MSYHTHIFRSCSLVYSWRTIREDDWRELCALVRAELHHVMSCPYHSVRESQALGSILAHLLLKLEAQTLGKEL